MHFKRSINQIGRNRGLIKAEEEDSFISDIQELRNVSQVKFKYFQGKVQKILSKYPSIEKWLL